MDRLKAKSRKGYSQSGGGALSSNAHYERVVDDNCHSECNEESQCRHNIKIKEVLWLKPQNACKVRGEVSRESRKVAFSLAEVLITLGIIGVVAALTLPSVITSYKNQVTVAKLKKAYSTLSQVAQRSVADNGPINYQSGELVTESKTKEFFDTYWLPYFKGAKVYPNGKYINLNNGEDLYKLLTSGFYDSHIRTQYTAGRILFTSSDGIMYNIHILDWVYKYDDKGNLISQTGVYSPKQYAYVDINGLNPPNTLGKDVFFFTVDFDKMQVLPYGFSASSAEVDVECKKTGVYCPAKIMRDGWRITY